MGLKNKSKKYIQKNLSPEVQEIMGFNDVYWAEQKENRRNSFLSKLGLSLIALGLAGSIATSASLNYTNEQYGILMQNVNDILTSIKCSEVYIQAKSDYENSREVI